MILAMPQSAIAQAIDNEPFAGPKIEQFPWKLVKISKVDYVSMVQVEQFYRFDKIQRDGKSVLLSTNDAEARFEVGSHRCSINKVQFILSHPIQSRINDPSAYLSALDLKDLLDPVLRPKHIQGAKNFNTVIIDPGHGGKDKGATGLESQYTLILAKLLKAELEKKGFRTVLTRQGNVSIPLGDRVRIANAHDNAIMISLHFNASPKPQVNGMETYTMSARVPRPANRSSVALAAAVHSRVLLDLNQPIPDGDFNTTDRGIRRARFNILSECKHPTIYLEAGYLTNKAEAAKIKNPAYQQRLASAIARGIEAYQVTLQKK